MTTIYKTQNSEFHVDPVEKTVRRVPLKGNLWWHDGVDVKYEFMTRQFDGSIYFHAIDPDTGGFRPFVTSRVLEVV